MRSCFCLLTSVSLLALPLTTPAAEPTVDKLGQRIEAFSLIDNRGKAQSLTETKDHKALVLVFLSPDCPVSTSYSQPLEMLAADYAAKHVAVVGILPDVDAATAAKFAVDYKLTFPVFADPEFRAVRAVEASVTPETFVLDADGKLRYRGRIDDAYSERLRKNPQITHHDLRRALDEVLAGKSVTTASTRAVGCSIDRRPVTKSTAATTVTYHRDVEPILQVSCQGCHRPGEVGPFSLLTYKQAVTWANDLKEFTRSHKMPPWKPIAGPGFHNERRLTEKEITTLAAWVDGGTPEGDPKDAPKPRAFPSGWQLGTPDVVLTPTGDFQLDATGRDAFRCFVLPTNFTDDVDVVAVEVRPGNPRVVHHALLFLDNTGQGRKLERDAQLTQTKDAKDFGPAYTTGMGGIGFRPSGALNGWAPGQMPRFLPDGIGWHVQKGSDVVMQLHYHRNGRVEKDRTSIGLYLAKKPVHRRYQSIVIPGRFLFIPAGSAHFKSEGSVVVNQECYLHHVMPHMHMLGRSVQVTLTPPTGAPTTLVAINDWDYNWQESYYFKDPVHVVPGTRVTIAAEYDNSAANPRNPSQPPRPVFWGEQTTNEMCFGFLGATSTNGERIRIERK